MERAFGVDQPDPAAVHREGLARDGADKAQLLPALAVGVLEAPPEALNVDVEYGDLGLRPEEFDPPGGAQSGSAAESRAPQMTQFGIAAADALDKRNALRSRAVRRPVERALPPQLMLQFQQRDDVRENPMAIGLVLGIEDIESGSEHNGIGGGDKGGGIAPGFRASAVAGHGFPRPLDPELNAARSPTESAHLASGMNPDPGIGRCSGDRFGK